MTHVFIVIMYRWGDIENHAYCIGAFSSLELAKEQGELEEEYRGGKYTARIIKSKVDPGKHPYEVTVARELPDITEMLSKENISKRLEKFRKELKTMACKGKPTPKPKPTKKGK